MIGQFALPFLVASIFILVIWAVVDERRSDRREAQRKAAEAEAAQRAKSVGQARRG